MKNISEIEFNEIKIKKEDPPYKCKTCGEGVIENPQEICPICGWQDCDILYQHPDCLGGPSILSFNQYKKVWENNKEIIKIKKFGKYGFIKQKKKKNPSIYGKYSREQINVINKHKNNEKKI